MTKANLELIKQIEKLAADLNANASDHFSEANLAQLQAELHAKERQENLNGTVLRLQDYLAAVKMVMQETFDHHVWVQAEIRHLSSKGGHYYLELAEKDAADRIVASCKGTLWRYRASSVLVRFRQSTGMDLQDGLGVLLKVSANFHPQYGFSLNIEDIDPSYTLGNLALRYQAIKQALQDEGLLELNASLPMPFDIQQVLVIAPEKAAGLGDFRAEADRLMQAGACQFYYHHATFQGNHAPDEIRQAIYEATQTFLATHGHHADLLVIIRGGGAVGDLAYLNDYQLAALVAEQPMPVWVGIGHERDRVLLDEVAHQSFDTPSKVIAGIITHLTQLVYRTQQHFAKIAQNALQICQKYDKNSTQILQNIRQISTQTLIQEQKNSENLLIKSLKNSQIKLKQSEHILRHTLNQLTHSAQTYLQSYTQECNHLCTVILLNDPQKILKQGYLIAKDAQNHLIKSVEQTQTNQTITLKFYDGERQAQIIES